MRTVEDIEKNLRLIDELRRGLARQIEIVDGVYRTDTADRAAVNAMETLAVRLRDWQSALLSLWHLELERLP